MQNSTHCQDQISKANIKTMHTQRHIESLVRHWQTEQNSNWKLVPPWEYQARQANACSKPQANRYADMVGIRKARNTAKNLKLTLSAQIFNPS